MKINGLKLDFDVYDYDTLKRYEDALKVVNDTNIEYTSDADLIKANCELINNFFDTVFGKGISEKMFGNKYNYKVSIETFEKVILEINELKAGITKYTNEKISKYSKNRSKRQ